MQDFGSWATNFFLNVELWLPCLNEWTFLVPILTKDTPYLACEGDLQSSRKTFLATSPVGLVTDQAHWSETKSTSPI